MGGKGTSERPVRRLLQQFKGSEDEVLVMSGDNC